MRINLHLLRLFHAVAELGSFSRAAESLNISQPAVSKGVRQLEVQLDAALIERGPGGPRGGLRLTETGLAMVEHARGLFALERAAVDDLRARREARRGHLVLGASTTVAAYWLPTVLAAFHHAHPEADVTLRVGNTEMMTRALVDCAIDLAVVEGQVADSRLSSRVWRQDPLVIAVPKGGRDARPQPEDWLDRPWLMREPGSGTRSETDTRLKALGLTPARRLEIDSNEGIARAVAAGLGVAMLPHRVVADLVRLGDLDILPLPRPAPPTRPLSLLRLDARAPSPLAEAFVAALDAAEAG